MASGFALIPASYVYLRRGDEVFLQHRRRGYLAGHWAAGAAGHVEPGETARQAAVREAREELGIELAAESLSLVTVLQRTDGGDDPIEQRVEWFWTADRWRGEPRIMEPDKVDAVGWFGLAALPEPVSPYELWLLTRMRDGTLAADSSYGFDAPAG